MEGHLSWQAVTWVLEFSEATSYSRLVLIAIASHANREGKNAFPSLDTISREALISRREVIYCIYELRHVGSWLEKVHNMHQLESGKGAQKQIKGANSALKGANTTRKQVLNIIKSTKSTTERLEEPSKARTVRQLAKSICIPEPSKSKPWEQQKAELRQKGFLQ
jgi:hypothetical protein